MTLPILVMRGFLELFGDKMQDIETLLEVFIYQTTYFLIYVQLLCFVCLFGKYRAKWRDICVYLFLFITQCILASAGYSGLDIPVLNALHYACFILSALSFSYLMILLYRVAKVKNEADKKSKKDFLYIVAIIVVAFIAMVVKMVYDLV